MNIAELYKKAKSLPLTPGVYVMRDGAGKVIYVGKAKRLQARVKQYFTRLSSHTPKTRKMVENVNDFEVLNAPTELDALLLENTLIKKYKPKYNILLKDDKGYPYIKLSAGDYPRFSVASKREGAGRFFGPFGGRGTANAALRAVTALFLLPDCKRVFPRDIGKGRPCLKYDMGKCCGVCAGKLTREEYAERIDGAARVFSGKGAEVEKVISRDMEKAADLLDFEEAARLRDRLRALSALRQSNVVCAGGADTDALGFHASGKRGCVVCLSYKNGALLDKRVVFYDGADEEDRARDVAAFIEQYYGAGAPVPAELLLPCEIEDGEALSETLSALRGKKCEVETPQKGAKRKAVELSEQNARRELELAESREQKSLKTVALLEKTLGVSPINRIEAYDISHTAGSDPVASQVVFEGFSPVKRDYKKYKIKLAVPGDDPAAMAETLSRRLSRAKDGDESFLPLPDLILTDGGITQVLAALSQVEKFGLKIPVFGMVKDDRHRTRALVDKEGRETGLAGTPALFAYIGRIQEEAHRFAISFHKELHTKNALKTALTDIPGVGDKRAKKLLSRFKSVRGVKEASLSELSDAVGEKCANAIKTFFEENEK